MFLLVSINVAAISFRVCPLSNLIILIHIFLSLPDSLNTMNLKDLLPKGGITDDAGSKPSSLESYKNRFADSGIDDKDVPEDWYIKLKHFLPSRQDFYKPTIPKPKKLTGVQKAFPLEDGDSFWLRMMKNENTDSKTKDPQAFSQQNSYISFGISDSSNSQTEVSQIN